MASRVILADENIPLVREAFSAHGTVRTLPGRSIRRAHLEDADILLVRSVTRIDGELLHGTPVRFVGTATIGTDHVDRDYLRARDIAFAHAPGSSAPAVADYVIAALIRLAHSRRCTLRKKTAGVVGCGNVGSRVASRLRALGLRVLKNDPPLAEQAERRRETHDFVPLDRILGEADIVTLHIPLTVDGPHPTHHLVDKSALQRMQPGSWLINTSRGAVIDGDALKAALRERRLAAAVLDVWENEPTPDLELLDAVTIATPHIAGYAYDSKVRGTAMLYQAVADHLGRPASWSVREALLAASAYPLVVPPPDPALPEIDWLDHAVRAMYEISADDARLRAIAQEPGHEQAAFFAELRKQYPLRREFARYIMPRTAVPGSRQTVVSDGLGVYMSDAPSIFSRTGGDAARAQVLSPADPQNAA